VDGLPTRNRRFEATALHRRVFSSHLPELKLPERPRQAFLDEVVGVDGVMRQTARKSSKVDTSPAGDCVVAALTLELDSQIVAGQGVVKSIAPVCSWETRLAEFSQASGVTRPYAGS
jgi:hypothetical protein